MVVALHRILPAVEWIESCTGNSIVLMQQQLIRCTHQYFQSELYFC